MPRIPLKRDKASFTGQIDVPTLEKIEELARQHERSMASVVRELLHFGLLMMEREPSLRLSKESN